MPHRRPSHITTRKRCLAWIDSHISVIIVVGCTFAGMLVRYSSRGFVSGDLDSFLLPWFDVISEHGLYEQVGDYNFLYQFLIWMMTKAHIQPLYSYKMLSIFFDFLLAVIGARIVYNTVRENTRVGNVEKWALAYCAIWLSPIVFLNSSSWGQCDSIYATFLLLSILLLYKKKHTLAFLMLGISFAFKLQAIFILPLFLYVYYVKREFSIFQFLYIFVAFFGLSLPLLLWGRNPMETVGVYVGQTGTYPAMFKNYPSFWCFLCADKAMEAYPYMKYPAITIAAFVLLLLMIFFQRKFATAKRESLIMLGFLFVFTCVLFLPAMHERYGYVYEILAILLVFMIPKTLPLCLGLHIISLNTYGYYLYGTPVNYQVLTFLNFGIYLFYIMTVNKELTKLSDHH